MLRFARLCRYVLAVFFGITGAAKLFDIDGFAQKISDFGIVADAYLGSAAWILAGAECLTAVLCFVRARSGTYLAILLLLLFLAVLTYGVAIGLDVDCGCLPFGVYESLQAAILRDLLLLTLAVVALRGEQSPKASQPSPT